MIIQDTPDSIILGRHTSEVIEVFNRFLHCQFCRFVERLEKNGFNSNLFVLDCFLHANSCACMAIIEEIISTGELNFVSANCWFTSQ